MRVKIICFLILLGLFAGINANKKSAFASSSDDIGKTLIVLTDTDLDFVQYAGYERYHFNVNVSIPGTYEVVFINSTTSELVHKKIVVIGKEELAQGFYSENEELDVFATTKETVLGPTTWISDNWQAILVATKAGINTYNYYLVHVQDGKIAGNSLIRYNVLGVYTKLYYVNNRFIMLGYEQTGSYTQALVGTCNRYGNDYQSIAFGGSNDEWSINADFIANRLFVYGVTCSNDFISARSSVKPTSFVSEIDLENLAIVRSLLLNNKDSGTLLGGTTHELSHIVVEAQTNDGIITCLNAQKLDFYGHVLNSSIYQADYELQIIKSITHRSGIYLLVKNYNYDIQAFEISVLAITSELEYKMVANLGPLTSDACDFLIADDGIITILLQTNDAYEVVFLQVGEEKISISNAWNKCSELCLLAPNEATVIGKTIDNQIKGLKVNHLYWGEIELMPVVTSNCAYEPPILKYNNQACLLSDSTNITYDINCFGSYDNILIYQAPWDVYFPITIEVALVSSITDGETYDLNTQFFSNANALMNDMPLANGHIFQKEGDYALTLYNNQGDVKTIRFQIQKLSVIHPQILPKVIISDLTFDNSSLTVALPTITKSASSNISKTQETNLWYLFVPVICSAIGTIALLSVKK